MAFPSGRPMLSGVYIGHSKQHSSSVALIWNPATKLVSVQYHILFDKGFETTTLLNATFNSDALLLAFHDQLQSIEWLHSDQYADTKLENTLHYYFDGDWDLNSHLYNTKWSNQPHQLQCTDVPDLPATDTLASQHEGASETGATSADIPASPLPVSQLGSLQPPNPKCQCTHSPNNSDTETNTPNPSLSTMISALLAQGLSNQTDPMSPPKTLTNNLNIHALNSILETHANSLTQCLFPMTTVSPLI